MARKELARSLGAVSLQTVPDQDNEALNTQLWSMNTRQAFRREAFL